MTTTACGREEGLGATTLLELLRARAEVQGAEVAVIFLRDGERDEDRITYQELDARARAIAAVLLDRGLAGQRVLLLYPPGIEYIAGLFGCAYAGVVAVPAYPPDPARLARSMPRMLSIARDAGVRVALTIAPIRELAGTLWAQLAELRDLELLATDALTDPAGWRDPDLDPDHLALLQYTSGSVATPKGVMLTHRNVLANEAMIRQAGSTERDRLFAAWLPPYHDMGLFAGIVHPIYLGIPTVLMSPESFLRRPHRWLMAISRFQATITVAPDFAFDLCVRRHAGERGEELDLSSLRVAFNGAEPVRAATMDRFTETFGRHGFRRSAFNPCYGMAEATLAVSAGDRDADPIVRRFDAQALEQHRVVAAPPGASGGRTLVGCGRALGDGQVRVVAPETRHPCGPDQVGEIWIAGPHVAAGYWNRPEDSAHAFQARLADGDGPFLRTGDLGFVSDGELFVTGRLKDLIILRGRNHYPHDIEGTVQDVHPALRPGCGAAFGFEVGDQERLVVVQEVDGERAPPLEQLLADARQAIAEAHDVVPHELVLIRRGSVPKTTSGKIQRRACAAAYRAGELEIVARWQAPAEPAAGPAPSAGVTAEAIQRWLVRELSRQVGVPEAEIDEQRPLFAYGLDSIVAVELTLDLEAWLGRPVPASTPYDYPTIQAIAAALSASTVAAPAAAS
ncbi:MAG TPA: AMP-binding protein, partial [Kofleriaceae bacterium]|nr:AMP-binding protein [Kofleriaceae bacterium]